MSEDSTPSVKPRPVSKRLRFEVLRRDGHTCRYCGAKAPDVPLTVDHVIPTTLGGTNDPGNLVTACRDCNSGKTSTSPDEHTVADVSALALRLGKALEQVAAQQRTEAAQREGFLREFQTMWGHVYGAEDGSHEKYNNWLGDGWIRSLDTFVARGLTHDDLNRLLFAPSESGTVRNGDVWRYFCGCCWRELTDRFDRAKALIESE